MAYQVLTADNGTVIADTDSDLWVQVNELKEVIIAENTAYCRATLYRVNGGFIPDKIYVFQARKIDLATLKHVVDFFFTTLLETGLYVKEVPQDSVFYPEEALRLYGDHKEGMNDGAISVIYAGGAE